MVIAAAALCGWLHLLATAVCLGAAAKRADELARVAYGFSAVPSQSGTRPADGVGTVQRFSRPVAERCELCGAQR
jgi:hypothetical protein